MTLAHLASAALPPSYRSLLPYGEASFDTYAHFSIVPNPTEGEGGAMIELRTVREAQRARKGLSGLNFADTELRVGWPSDYVPLTEEEVKKCGIRNQSGSIKNSCEHNMRS